MHRKINANVQLANSLCKLVICYRCCRN